MRIAVFYNLAFGGAKRVVYEHVKGLSKKGHSIDLYTTDEADDAFNPSQFCKNVYRYHTSREVAFPFIDRLINDFNTFFTLKKTHRKIAHEIDKRKYDIVLVHPDKVTQSPFILRFLKTPSAYYCQEPFRIAYEYAFRLKENVGFLKRGYEELTRSYRKRIDRENVRCASLTIASCFYVRERMIESYDVYPKIVNCGVDEKSFRPLHSKKKNKILYVGSPELWTDGYDLVKKALLLIPPNKRPEVYIVIWKKVNGERLTENELVSLYNESFVTMCTSRLETFGLVPLESMACGVPVIATNVSGHRETVKNNETGFLVDFDSEEIAQKLLSFINNKQMALQMGKHARKHVENRWTWKYVINDLENVLARMV